MSIDNALFNLDQGLWGDGEGWGHAGRYVAEYYYREVIGPYSGGPTAYEVMGSKMPDARYEVEELSLRRLTERLC